MECVEESRRGEKAMWIRDEKEQKSREQNINREAHMLVNSS